MIGNKGYIKLDGSVTWGDAKSNCESKGYRLASMETDDEITYVKSVASSNGDIWLGLTNPSQTRCRNLSCNNVFTWAHDGSPFTIADQFTEVDANEK